MSAWVTVAAQVTFWTSIAFIAYTMSGYPLLLRLVTMFRTNRYQREPIRPRVSVIIAAHNSEKVIAQKLENTLALQYPDGLREVLVASDASTDATHAIVESFADRGVVLAAVAERRGKHHAQRVALEKSSGEVIVFTDSGIHLEPDALEQIVSNFADPAVGCVSSEDRIASSHSASGEGAYVSSEMRLRRLESLAGSLVGVSGSFFAARREVCAPWHSDQSSDFFVPLHTVMKGFRTIVDPAAVATFGVVASKSEFMRKVRTIVHGLVVFFDHIQLTNPFRYGFFAVQLISHKLCRWLMPFAFMGVLVASTTLAVHDRVFAILAAMQAAGYILGCVALVTPVRDSLLGRLTSFLVVSIAATLVSWYQFARGEKYVTWEPSRR
jgi:hypothetical protein